jgi:hypothetical protein
LAVHASGPRRAGRIGRAKPKAKHCHYNGNRTIAPPPTGPQWLPGSFVQTLRYLVTTLYSISSSGQHALAALLEQIRLSAAEFLTVASHLNGVLSTSARLGVCRRISK